MPQKLLVPMKEARDFARTLIRKRDPKDFVQLKRCIDGAMESFLEIDKSFEIEQIMLASGQDLIDQRVEAHVLGMMPDEKGAVTVQHCSSKFVEFQASELMKMASAPMKRKVNCCQEAIDGMVEGISPDAALASGDAFYKSFLHHCSFFMVVTDSAGNKKTGASALQFEWERIEKLLEENSPKIKIDMLEPFHKCKWMLGKAQQLELPKWTKMICDAEAAKKEVIPTCAIGGSSSSTSSPSTSKAAAKKAPKLKAKPSLMKYF